MDKGISAVLIVKDEAGKLNSCLDALSWVDEIIIVDSGSADDTVTIARKYTPKVFFRKFDNYSDQKNYAISQASKEWIFSVDADEIVSKELRESIQNTVNSENRYNGYFVLRQNYLFGKKLRYGGQQSEKILRFFRNGKGKFVQPIHEKVIVEGLVGVLPGDLVHRSTDCMEDYFKKLDVYTQFEVQWMMRNGVRFSYIQLILKPAAKFIYNYLFRLGFMDCYEGFLYHVLSSVYDFMKYARLREQLNAKRF